MSVTVRQTPDVRRISDCLCGKACKSKRKSCWQFLTGSKALSEGVSYRKGADLVSRSRDGFGVEPSKLPSVG